MKTVYRYPFQFGEIVSLQIPKGAEIIGVWLRYGTPNVYVRVDPSSPRVTRSFAVVATGEPMADELDDWAFVSSIVVKNQVWHVFDSGELPGVGTPFPEKSQTVKGWGIYDLDSRLPKMVSDVSPAHAWGGMLKFLFGDIPKGEELDLVLGSLRNEGYKCHAVRVIKLGEVSRE